MMSELEKFAAFVTYLEDELGCSGELKEYLAHYEDMKKLFVNPCHY